MFNHDLGELSKNLLSSSSYRELRKRGEAHRIAPGSFTKVRPGAISSQDLSSPQVDFSGTPIGVSRLLVPIDFSDDKNAPGYLDPGTFLHYFNVGATSDVTSETINFHFPTWTPSEKKLLSDVRGGLWPYLSLTGTGFMKDENCGTVQALVGLCNTKPAEHRPVLIPHTCGRKVCPVCWTTWAERAGARVTDQINGYLTAMYGPVQGIDQGELRYLLPRHVSFHPSRQVLEDLVVVVLTGLQDPRDFQASFQIQFRAKAIAVMIEAGARAGIYIPHDIRLLEDRDTARADNELDTDRYRAVLDCPDWRERVKWWPHAHGIVFGKLENANAFYDRTGWTYRVHRVVSDPGPLVRYLLSHSIAPETKKIHAVVPFGDMKRLDKLGEHRVRRHVLCEECTAEGREESFRVIGRLVPGSLFREHDLDPGRRVRHGRGRPEAWAIDNITDKHFVRVERRGVYRLRAPGERRLPKPIDPRNENWSPSKGPGWKDHIKYHSEENWRLREASGEIPGDWFTYDRDSPG